MLTTCPKDQTYWSVKITGARILVLADCLTYLIIKTNNITKVISERLGKVMVLYSRTVGNDE